MTVSTKIVLQGDPSGAVAAINRVKTELGALQSVGARAMAFGGGLAGAGVVAGLVSMTKSAIDAADALDELSTRTGISVEDLSKLQYATTVLGVDQEKLQKGLIRLNAEIAAAGSGNQAAAERFKALGVDVRESDGQIRGALPVFLDLAEALEALPEGAERTNAAIGIFGEKVGKDMVLALSEGRAALQGLFDELEKAGGVVSGDFARQAGKFNEQLDRLSGLSSSAGIAIGTSLVPALGRMLEKFLALNRSGAGKAGFLDAILGRSPADFFRSNRELFEKTGADIEKLKGRIADFRKKNQEDDIDAIYRLEWLQKMRDYYGQAADIDEGKTEAQDNAAKRLQLQRQLQTELGKLERLRAIAAGQVNLDILDDDRKRTDAQIKQAERLRDALKSAWQTSIDESRKAAEAAVALLAQAAGARDQGRQSAEDVRRQALSPSDQAALNTRDLRLAQETATTSGLLAKLAAQHGRTENATRQAEQALRAADETLRLADKAAGDPETRARAIEAASEARANALEAQARLKQQESTQLEERAKGQQATLSALEKQLAELQAKAAALTVEVDITQAEGNIASLQSRLEALQDKTITVTVQQVTTGDGAPLPEGSAAPQFAWGGWTGPGGKWQPAGLVHAGEFVTRQEIVRQPGALAFLAQFNRTGMAALRRWLPGFADGGLVSRLRGTPLLAPASSSRQVPAVFHFPGLGRYPASLASYDFDRLQEDFSRAALQKGARR